MDLVVNWSWGSDGGGDEDITGCDSDIIGLWYWYF